MRGAEGSWGELRTCESASDGSQSSLESQLQSTGDAGVHNPQNIKRICVYQPHPEVKQADLHPVDGALALLVLDPHHGVRTQPVEIRAQNHQYDWRNRCSHYDKYRKSEGVGFVGAERVRDGEVHISGQHAVPQLSTEQRELADKAQHRELSGRYTIVVIYAHPELWERHEGKPEVLGDVGDLEQALVDGEF
jgi:hypothetical protein